MTKPTWPTQAIHCHNPMRAVKATVKEGEGDWAQIGLKKREKKTKALIDAGVVISRAGAANWKAVHLQTPMHMGPGF